MFRRRLFLSVVAVSISAWGAGANGVVGDSDDGAGAGYDQAAIVATCGPKVAVSAIRASTSDANLPAGAIDGNAATRWSGAWVGANITADLGAAKALCGVSIPWYRGDERTDRFTVSVSSDGTTFKQVFAGTSILAAATQNVSVTASTARDVRITVNGNSQNTWASICELQVNAAIPRCHVPPQGQHRHRRCEQPGCVQPDHRRLHPDPGPPDLLPGRHRRSRVHRAPQSHLTHQRRAWHLQPSGGRAHRDGTHNDCIQIQGG